MARVEREKYEERMGMKKLPPSKDRIAELEEKTQKMLDRLGPDQVEKSSVTNQPKDGMNIKNFNSG